MKKNIQKIGVISAALLTLALSANAQWTETATSVYLTNGTKPVGIGTTAPGYPLDIKQVGNCNFRVQSITSGSSNLILARSAAAGVNCLVNYKTGTTALWYTGVAGNNTDFRIRNGAGADYVFVSQAAGNVGIGTTAPTYKLEVTADASFNGVRVGLGNGSIVSNTVMGTGALNVNTTGFNNVAVGAQSMATNTTGTANTGLGYYSLYYNTTGGSNTALGYATLLNNISGGFNTAVGTSSLTANTTGTSNSTCGANALLSNTTGSLNSAFGTGALLANTTGNNNTALGTGALRDNTVGSDNIAIGRRAMQANQTGSYNVAVGDSALTSVVNPNNQYPNVAVGSFALMANTTGAANTALGFKALYATTTGNSNTASGNYALLSNVSGNWNSAYGNTSLQSNTTGNGNTASGYESLVENTEGYSNSGFGFRALSHNTTGLGNVAMGYDALRDNITGSNNTAIGNNADVPFGSGNLTNATALGYNAQVDSSNKVRIGNTSVTSIGGQVAWTSFSDARIKDNVKEDIHGMDFINALRPVTFHYNVAKTDALLGNNNEENWEGKYDIEKIAFSGFLAQEVDEAAKKVGYDFSGVDKHGRILGLRYSEFVVPVVKGMQELSKQNEELKKENAEMKARLDMIEKSLSQCCSNFKSGSTPSDLQNGSDLPKLVQNQPNPFNQTSVIKFYVPSTFRTAQLVITNMMGVTMKSIKLTQAGVGQVTINANELAAGSYLYSLVIDDAKADSKKMELTK